MKRRFTSGCEKRKKKKLLEAELSNLPQIDSYFKITQNEDLFIGNQPDVPTTSTNISINTPTDTTSETVDSRTDVISPNTSKDETRSSQENIYIKYNDVGLWKT
ncbi:hypothetical protein DMN91_009819 [Ooceraea biroi]|uniref:Uncharacterized protein n=1 Tax=Ooceraea biroi TaxID=2015173 RepID=A0A3L8DBT8_OOCBI|nr:hypothetical protein DMN91_009819 [Ooceraea biroi]